MGGKPSTWNHYHVGGAGRPEDWGGQVGSPGDVAASVWQRIGPNGDRVRQVTPSGQPAPSGAHAARGSVRVPKQPRRARKSKAEG